MKLLKYLCYIFFILCVFPMFSSCSSDDDDSPGNRTYRRTVLVYISAQNSLGDGNGAAADSAEIAYGAQFLPSTDDNLLLYLDDALKPRIYQFYRSSSGKGYYRKVQQYTTDLNSSDPSTLTAVLNVMKNTFPSQSYGLVLWSHGMSWIPAFTSFDMELNYSNASSSNRFYPKSFGIDTGEGGNMPRDRQADGKVGSQMEIIDMANAIQASGVHLDYILFDACMMQSIEVAYDLRNSADYLVGCPATTSSYGCVYYDQIRDGLFAYPTNDQNIRKMVDTYYYNVMEDPENKRYYQNQGCVFSVIKTSEIEALTNATRQFIPLLNNNNDYLDLSSIDGYVDFSRTGYPDCYDMSSVMHLCLSESDYAAWKTVLDQCVIYKRLSPTYYAGAIGSTIILGKADLEYGCGLSMFVPQKEYESSPAIWNYNKEFKNTTWYTAANCAAAGW